jgi:hypothetical protein
MDRTKVKNNLGVIFTSWISKQNPYSKVYKRRFMVLTTEALHWFKRSEGYDLFGEERGHLALDSILNVQSMKDESNIFLIQSTDSKKRYFQCDNEKLSNEWITAIRSAIKNYNDNIGKNVRRSITSIISDNLPINNNDDGGDVNILFMSLKSLSKLTEVVIARNPSFGHIIIMPNVQNDDICTISLSNGGYVELSATLLCSYADNSVIHSIPVQNVMLASSLNLTFSYSAVGAVINTNSSNDKKKYDEILNIIRLMISNESATIQLMLDLMVLFVGLFSISSLTPNTSLVFVFAYVLAGYNVYTIVNSAVLEKNIVVGKKINCIIHGHSFTSPEEPIHIEDAIPERFIAGCGGNMEEARRRWDITRHWRETEGLDKILQEEQPYFNIIKAHYPHYHAGRGKNGHVCYYERPGDLELDELISRGINLDKMLRHWLFVTEYQWEVLLNGDPLAKSIAIIDVDNVSLTDLAGDKLDFLKKTISYANQHYPERSYVIYIVNAPSYFTWIWSFVRPFVHENTQKKVHILSKKHTLEGLKEHIDESQIPIYYGGKLDYGTGNDSCRTDGIDVLEFNRYVEELNKKCKRSTIIPFSDDGIINSQQPNFEIKVVDEIPATPIPINTNSSVDSSADCFDNNSPKVTNRYRLMSTSVTPVKSK